MVAASARAVVVIPSASRAYPYHYAGLGLVARSDTEHPDPTEIHTFLENDCRVNMQLHVTSGVLSFMREQNR